DLDELARRELELVFRLGRRVMAVTLAEPGDGVDGEFLLALKPDAGAGGKSKNVLGLDVAPGAGVIGAGGAGPTNKGGRAKRQGVMPFRLDPYSHVLSRPSLFQLTA